MISFSKFKIAKASRTVSASKWTDYTSSDLYLWLEESTWWTACFFRMEASLVLKNRSNPIMIHETFNNMEQGREWLTPGLPDLLSKVWFVNITKAAERFSCLVCFSRHFSLHKLSLLLLQFSQHTWGERARLNPNTCQKLAWS